MNKLIAFLISCTLLTFYSVTAFSAGDEENIKKLSSFKKTGTAPGIVIPQEGKYMENIKKNILPKIKMPPGFEISLFARVPDARHMAVARNKTTVWVGTRKDKVWQATDRDMDDVADTVEQFSPSVKFDIPNGVCFSTDGHLYVAERNRVLWFPAAEFFMESPDTVAIPIIPQGELIPPEEESYNHSARVCAINPADNKLYVSMGQPFNVAPPEKYPLYDQVGIGGMIRFNRFPGKLEREVVGIGIRNSVGHAFNPKDGTLWFTDNQVDGMGDETPPGELNKACGLSSKVWYGHPYTGGGEVRTNEYKDKKIPKAYADNYCKPQVEMIAHAADLGMMFYTGNQFPKKYHNAIFSAQHGSWNAIKPRGARVMVTYLDKKGNAKKTEPFAEGWMTEMGTYLGRPVDVQQYFDGSILISDDKAGVVYRIVYKGV
ncbi:MAG: sorbosone dehydrogenase [Pelagibacteraceae bacterium TMED246]|nr:MAG: sorbosone dehydrogenase [Pelagibacteraceae bacterium TMED246]|tara:strand:+ start:1714 stop:3006 length:1293 start_codon:yes stop_codon:yes gene_type:complete